MGIGSPSSLLRTKDVENHIAYLSDRLIYDCFLVPTSLQYILDTKIFIVSMRILSTICKINLTTTSLAF